MVKARAKRRGISSVIAMTYLMLFAVLALGFYAQVNSSMQVSNNETRTKRAMLAAESGLAFARYHLSQVRIPPLTATDAMLAGIYDDLDAPGFINGSKNLKYGSMDYVANSHIRIPASSSQYVEMEPGGDGFQVRISQKAGTRRMVVRVIGASPIKEGGVIVGYNRAGIECEFDATEHKHTFFDYGIASKGTVALNPSNKMVLGNPASAASILSVGAVTLGSATNTMTSGISGEITVVGSANPTLLGPISVDGITNKTEILATHPDPADDHVHHIDLEDLPEFPVPDTAMFKAYATNTYVSGQAIYRNIRIPPNTNPTFNGPTIVRGVVFVEQPNVVTFAGQVEMQCVIVTEDKNVGTMAQNLIALQGNGGAKLPLQTLPVELDAFGNDIYKDVRNLTGSFIIAPGFDVSFTGNFGSFAGDVCGDRVTISGSSATIINGAVYTLDAFPLRITGNAQVTLGENPYGSRTGMRFSEQYMPAPDTYKEINPN